MSFSFAVKANWFTFCDACGLSEAKASPVLLKLEEVSVLGRS